jgi:hypothetical protein
VFLPAMYAIWFRIAPAAEPTPVLAAAPA